MSRHSETTPLVGEKSGEVNSSYEPPSSARKAIYDFVLWSLGVVFDCFFREIRARGAFRLPRNGPIIFVGAPHANQFIDPIILMGQVQKESGKRVSFLVAAKSYKRKFIGLISRSQMAIPVNRAQDNLASKEGLIYVESVDNLSRIMGKGTKFTRDCVEKGMIALPKSLGSAEVEKIISDTELTLKKDFKLNDKEKGLELLIGGCNYKAAPKVDQSQVYAQVFEHLANNQCLGIFPEGGSHDRPDLLPLKAGVAIMALGAMDANPECKLKIVPCGMNYFHPHKFRSRAIVEFGHPIEIPSKLVEMYRNPETSKDAIRSLLETVTEGLKSVTVTCDSYETLIIVQMARRLYADNFSSQLSLESIVEMNRRLVQGYQHFSQEPQVKNLGKKILAYSDLLKVMNIPDHEVENVSSRPKIITLYHLVVNFVQMSVLGLLSLPGFLLFSPVFIATKKISKRKAAEALAASTVKVKANDVIATWKILVSLGFAPVLYYFYSIVGTLYLRYKLVRGPLSYFDLLLSFASIYIASVAVTYSAVVVGDKGMDKFKSIRPLWLWLIDERNILELKNQRRDLSAQITEMVNEFGPRLYPDFNLLELQHKGLIKPHTDDSDEEEELKTETLRRRRLERSGSHSSFSSNGLSRVNSTFSFSDVPIFSNENKMSFSGESSEGEVESNTRGNTFLADKVREKMITENRQRNEE